MTKVSVNLETLKVLRDHARRAGALDNWAIIAIEYAEGCNAEIERLRLLIPEVVDHPILDRIARRVNNLIGQIELRRESECLEFRDKDGKWYEIVVRPIDGPSRFLRGD